MGIEVTAHNTVVLAGGINRVELFEGYTPGYKALLPIGGQSSIQYTLDALRAIPRVAQICVVGPEDLRHAVGADAAIVPAGETLMESIFNGLRHFADSPPVLIATADMPLITPAAITDFLDACAQQETTYAENLYLSVVPKRCYTGAYAQFTKGFNRFRDVAICHGNLMLADPRILQNTAVTRRVNALYSARKDPVQSALAIGLRVGLSYVLGVHLWHLLTLQQMANIASHRFHFGLLPVLTDHPEITIDVDEATDYAFVVQQLSEK
ncbi:MAG: NTP transferase domain-containing protein [Armatimonadota bacterium]